MARHNQTKLLPLNSQTKLTLTLTLNPTRRPASADRTACAANFRRDL